MPDKQATDDVEFDLDEDEGEGEQEQGFEEGCVVCGNPVAPGEKLCPIHVMVEQMTDVGNKKFRKSVQKNDLGGILVGALTSLGATLAGQKAVDLDLAGVIGGIPGYTEGPDAGPQQAPPPPPPRSRPIDPFAFLGLDRHKATAEDVRRMQKHFAKVFHADTGSGAVLPDQMAKVNQAVDACLAYLKQRGR